MSISYTLIHPLENVPATAVSLGQWVEDGNVRGVRVQFPCGHTASLTWNELRKARTAVREWNNERLAQAFFSEVKHE